MNAKDWIQKYEDHLFLTKNRAVNTVRGYISDLQLLYAHSVEGKLENWNSFTEDMAVEYVKALKKEARVTSIARKVYCFRGFFKFLIRQGCVSRNPFEAMEFRALPRALPKFLPSTRRIGCSPASESHCRRC